MTEEQVKRKLTAILSADVKGYSRLMEDDEETTVRTITAYREVMVSQIHGQNGRVVDAKGDNILAEFPSVVDAVRCAVKIQKELRARNADLPEHRRMEFRIGINLGDVIQEDDTIYGDGVNIAARLEALADGGGICISGSAYEQVGKKLPIGYEYLGEQRVKNIEKPVRAYKILLEPEAAGKLIGEERPTPRRWRWAVALVAIILVGGGLAIWNYYLRPPPIEPASVERMAFPLPDKPSIAVLPFVNMSGDPNQEYIADGITENIISALSKISKMFVIARQSTFTYKGKSVKVQQVSEDLGVRHLLEGSVQRSNDRVRITAQLVDATSGHSLWAEQYDRDMKGLFDLLDEITKEIVVALQVELTEGEQARIWYKRVPSLEVWGYFIRAASLFEHFTKEDNAKARELLERIVKLEPEYATAWTMLAWTYWIDARWGWSESPAESFKRAVELAQKAVALDDSSPDVHCLLGGIYLMQKQHEQAIAEGKKSIALAPNSATSHILLAETMYNVGRFEEAIVLVKKAMRLHPYYSAWYLSTLADSHAMAGHYEEALAVNKQLLDRSLKGEYPPLWVHVSLAANYIGLGQEKQARAHAAEVLRIDPNFSLEMWSKAIFFKYPSHLKRFLDYLRKAGLK
jgi:adenylate cyclase